MSPIKIEGSPQEIGSELFTQVCMPVVHEASRRMPPADLVKLYAGFVGAMYGALSADFGQATATHLMRHFTESLANIELEAAPTH